MVTESAVARCAVTFLKCGEHSEISTSLLASAAPSSLNIDHFWGWSLRNLPQRHRRLSRFNGHSRCLLRQPLHGVNHDVAIRVGIRNDDGCWLIRIELKQPQRMEVFFHRWCFALVDLHRLLAA